MENLFKVRNKKTTTKWTLKWNEQWNETNWNEQEHWRWCGFFIASFEKYFTSSSSLSNVEFEQVNVCWVYLRHLTVTQKTLSRGGKVTT